MAEARYRRTGQAFALVESGVMVRATANSPPRTAAGHEQVDQAAKSKPPAGSCSRILDQSLGPTRARSSWNRPLECPSTMTGPARGWAGRSLTCTPRQLNSHRTPDPDATYFALVTRRSNRVLCLSCDNSLLESRSPPRDASAGRSRPWPGCCPRQRVCPIPGRVDSW